MVNGKILEVRPFPDGRGIDEVLTGEVKFFHLEYMSDDSVWIGLDLNDGSMVHLRLNSKKRIKLLVEHESKDSYQEYR